MPYEAAEYYKLVSNQIIIKKKATSLNSGLYDFLIIPNNNLKEITKILGKYIKSKD